MAPGTTFPDAFWTLPGMPFCLVLDHTDHVSGGQVQHVRVYSVWFMTKKSGKVVHPTQPVPRQKHPSIARHFRPAPGASDSSNPISHLLLDLRGLWLGEIPTCIVSLYACVQSGHHGIHGYRFVHAESEHPRSKSPT